MVSSGFENEVLVGEGVILWVVFVDVVQVTVAYHDVREFSSYRIGESNLEIRMLV
jgi:hypothetical protein